MKISYNWLKQFIKTDWTSEDTAALLTELGLEVEVVEKYQTIKGALEGVVVGHVLTCQQHPNADRLRVTTVDVGGDAPLQIVCGAPNVAEGQKVLVATMGTTLYDKEGNAFQIKKGKIREVESLGMICAEDELGLGESHDGIMVLDPAAQVGTPAAQLFKIENDEVFEIGLTPNRADAMSHFGVARDLRAGMLQRNVHVELITPSVSTFRVDKRILKIDATVADAKLAPRYCGVTLSDVKVKPSPEWLQNRLKAIGITPKNNVVDVTNYVMHELGQPLHAFDAAMINGKIQVKNGLSGSFVTLDGVSRELHTDDLLICDDKGPLAIAGVMGGQHSAVNENTKTLFLESAYFDPVTVRKTAKRHGINSDASFRFERGIDPTITEYALKRACLLLKEVAECEVTSDIIDIYPKKIQDFPVVLNFNKAARIIGEELPKETIKKILASLDIKVNSISDAGLGLTIPAYRVDVQREIDVIEEILRVYGYNNIGFTNKLNATVASSSRTEDHKVQNIIAGQLTAMSFNEIMCNSLTKPDYVELSDYLKAEYNITMLNPLSSDLSAMRQSMLFSGLETIAFNSNRRRSDLRLFEFGKTYHRLPSGNDERKHLTLFVTGNKQAESWTAAQAPANFFQFKSYVQAILGRLGIEKFQIEPVAETDFFAEGLTLRVGANVLVEFGVVAKKFTKAFDIKNEVFYADFAWDNVLKIVSNKIKYTEIAKYPEVRRDLALLVKSDVTFEQLYNIARTTEKTLLKQINLFDVYEGKNLPEGTKSYALSFTLQDANKTLTDDQIEKIMTKLMKNFESQVGATLRS